MISFVTYFGIDVWWVFASILDICWHHLGTIFNVFGWSLFLLFVESSLIKNGFQKAPTVPPLFVICSTLFRRCFFRSFICSAWSPSISLLLSFWLHFVRFGCPFWSVLNIFIIISAPMLAKHLQKGGGHLHRKEAFPLHIPLSHLAWSEILSARALINIYIYIHICIYIYIF